MSEFAFAVLAFATLGLIGSYVVIRQSRKTGRRSVWSYILIWPLILERESKEDRGLFTKRELIGWGLLLLLIVLAVSLNL
jgi:hypothetical protein